MIRLALEPAATDKPIVCMHLALDQGVCKLFPVGIRQNGHNNG
jgi:hypothetical protein